MSARNLEPLSLRRASWPVEAAATDADEMVRALTADTPYGIFRSDAEGGCLYVNQRWCELSGLAVEEALGDGWIAALHPDDRERVLGEWSDAATSGRDSIVEYRFRRPDGGVSWIEGYATALHDEQGAVSGWVGTCLDLTARKQAERELERLANYDPLTSAAHSSPATRRARICSPSST
jgi:PAS domain S-box-containing protein